MITEDYVSFETAALLKEKGMDASCFNHYVQKNNNDGTSEAVTVCTLQMAMKWLREVHNVHIEIFVIKNYDKKICEYTYTIMDLNFPGSDDGIDCCNKYKTYEEACETAIKYCLENLI